MEGVFVIINREIVMSKKLFALEELQEEEPIVVAPEESDEEISGQLAQSATEIDDLSDQINHAEEVEETISGIGENLSKLKPEETIPAPAMEAINIAIDGLLGSIGMQSKSRKVALEGFSKATTAMESMETIKALAVRIWEAIKKAFFSMVEYVKKFFAWIKKSIAGVVAKANAVEKQIAEVKKEHSSSDISAAENKVKAATEEIFKGNAFTASSSSPEYLKLSNNPSPQKPDFKYDIGVGKNPKATDGSIDYFQECAIKNKKLANYFRSTGDHSQLNGWIKNGVVENAELLEDVFSIIKEQATDLRSEFKRKASVGASRNNLDQWIIADRIFPILQTQITHSESIPIDQLRNALKDARRSNTDTDTKEHGGFMRLPFDEDIKISPFAKPVPTISFTKERFTTRDQDIIQLCFLDVANQLTKIIKSQAGLGEDLLSYLEMSLNEITTEANTKALDLSHETDDELRRKSPDQDYINSNATKMAAWKNTLQVARQFFDFAIKDVGMLMIYRQKMNTHLLEWFSESTREWQRILTPEQVASALAKNA